MTYAEYEVRLMELSRNKEAAMMKLRDGRIELDDALLQMKNLQDEFVASKKIEQTAVV